MHVWLRSTFLMKNIVTDWALLDRLQYFDGTICSTAMLTFSRWSIGRLRSEMENKAPTASVFFLRFCNWPYYSLTFNTDARSKRSSCSHWVVFSSTFQGWFLLLLDFHVLNCRITSVLWERSGLHWHVKDCSRISCDSPLKIIVILLVGWRTVLSTSPIYLMIFFFIVAASYKIPLIGQAPTKERQEAAVKELLRNQQKPPKSEERVPIINYAY